MNADIRNDDIATIFITFFGIQLIGMGIDAGQAVSTERDQFKTAWKNIRSENINKWLTMSIIASLIILSVHILEAYASSHEAKRFAELAIKRYARKANINVSNLGENDFHDIADLILSHISNDEKTRILNKCTEIREKLYTAEAQRLQNNITQKQYNKICKQYLVEMTKYTTSIIQEAIENNPGLVGLIKSITSSKTKYIPIKNFISHQK